MHRFSIRVLVINVLLFSASSPEAFGQLKVNAGIGVSDIGFLMEGEFNYFGYELSSLQHSLPAFAYCFGLSNTFRQNKRLQPSIELLYARNGINYSHSYLFDDIGYHVRIDYLKLPLLLHLNLNKKSGRNPGVDLGPYLSYRIRAVRDLTLLGDTDRRTVDNLNPIDAGIIIGASKEFIRTPFHLNAGIRISYSLVNMMSPLGGSLARYYGPEEEYARNITIMLTLSSQIRND